MTTRPRPRRRQADLERPAVIRCAIYTRKSTDEGLDNGFSSLDAQREAAEAYIASQRHEGWVCLPDHYNDGGFSGGNMDRPALRRLLTDVEAGKVDAIVVYKLDRFTRSLLDFVRIVEILDRHNVSFVSITQQFATNTSMGRLTLNMLLSFAQFERDIIAERTRDKMSAARRKGKWVGGIPILGYDVDPQGGRIVVNEEEAKRVREIFEVYLEKGSLTETTRELHRRRWTTKRWVTRKGDERGGGPFEKNTLAGLLANRTYVGKVDYRGTIYPGEHEAIVDEEVWEKAQRLLRRNGSARGRGADSKHGALLRGLLHCVPCDAPMIHVYSQKKNGARYRYYTCSAARKRGWSSCPAPSLPAGEIERFVVERVRSIGTDPDLLKEVTAKVHAQVQEQIERLAEERGHIEKDLKQHAKEVKQIVGATGRSMGASGTTTCLADLQERITVAEQRLADIRREQAALKKDSVDETDLAAALKDFDPIWETLTLREQARIIHLLIERVSYDGAKETVSITFRPGGIRALARKAS